MKNFLMVGFLAMLSHSAMAGDVGGIDPNDNDVSREIDAALSEGSGGPRAAGVCDLAALAFANVNFRNAAQAQSQCDALVQQTGGQAADCKVVKLTNGGRRAQFRKLLKVNQQGIAALLAQLTAFIQNGNFFVNNIIKVQSAVNNGCGG